MQFFDMDLFMINKYVIIGRIVFIFSL
jgi:hypothetical protein